MQYSYRCSVQKCNGTASITGITRWVISTKISLSWPTFFMGPVAPCHGFDPAKIRVPAPSTSHYCSKNESLDIKLSPYVCDRLEKQHVRLCYQALSSLVYKKAFNPPFYRPSSNPSESIQLRHSISRKFIHTKSFKPFGISLLLPLFHFATQNEVHHCINPLASHGLGESASCFHQVWNLRRV